MMSETNYESYPPLFRPPPNTPILDKREPVSKLAFDPIPMIDLKRSTTTKQDVLVDKNSMSTTLEMSEVCRDWGMFRLVNHGVPVTLLNQIQEHAQKLFALPFEIKKTVFSSSTDTPISYFWGTPALTPSGTALEQSQFQWMEGFNVSLSHLSHFHYQDLLLENFRCLVEEYGKHQARVATTIFKVLASDVNLQPNYLSVGTGILRVYRYPRCFQPERAWGIDVHTDSSVLSIINQDEVGGLQFYKDHQWLDVMPIPTSFIVNIGDMLQAMSDDKYKSVKHRVKVNKNKERISIGYFIFPAEGTVIQSAKYKPFSYADFRAQVQHDLKTLGFKTGLQKFKIYK